MVVVARIFAFGVDGGWDPSSGLIEMDQNYTLHVSVGAEPETYALMLAGLGLVGFAARRRKL